MSKTILLIEDEASIADTIRYSLKEEGFTVEWCMLGADGIAMLHSHNTDLVILDVGLPDISGFEVCKKIRQFSAIPIIFLSARSDEIDRIVGLELGGDDYVSKPFSPRELAARVKANLRRTEHLTEEPSQTLFDCDRLIFDVRFKGQVLNLTKLEFGILELLIKNSGRVYSRQQLMDAIWSSPEESFDRVVDTHIKTIRSKLRLTTGKDSYIKTHRGLGYSFNEISE